MKVEIEIESNLKDDEIIKGLNRQLEIWNQFGAIKEFRVYLRRIT